MIDPEAAEAALKAVEAPFSPPGEIKLSSGVRLQVLRVPPLLTRQAVIQLKEPEVPIVEDQEQGRRMLNPNDPDYLAAMEKFRNDQNMAVLAVYILVGTRLIGTPPGMPRPQDDEWLENLETLGIKVNVSTVPARYLSWVQMVAMTSQEDFNIISAAVGRASGIIEEDVDKAVDSFRSDEDGREPIETGVSESSQNGNRVPAVTSGPSY